MLTVAVVADQQAGSGGRRAGLDTEIVPSAQLAGHQYSSGSRMVVTERSASVMIQTLPAGVPYELKTLWPSRSAPSFWRRSKAQRSPQSPAAWRSK